MNSRANKVCFGNVKSDASSTRSNFAFPFGLFTQNRLSRTLTQLPWIIHILIQSLLYDSEALAGYESMVFAGFSDFQKPRNQKPGNLQWLWSKLVKQYAVFNLIAASLNHYFFRHNSQVSQVSVGFPSFHGSLSRQVFRKSDIHFEMLKFPSFGCKLKFLITDVDEMTDQCQWKFKNAFLLPSWQACWLTRRCWNRTGSCTKSYIKNQRL